ncbi:MAG: phosphate ABC transporter permease subunit PstC [Candidatus Bathyarchaeota archaeon]|nr:phosphate ABC transporter permease subunit PstC [Candidatus Bathyarchaeota archaeon]
MDSRILKEKIVKIGLLACAVSSIAIVLIILSEILANGIPQLIDWMTNGFGMKWVPHIGDEGVYGIIPYMYWTLYIGIAAMLIATAIGLPCAIYLSEFASSKIRNLIKPSLEMLSGFPSIILGLIGATIVLVTLQRYITWAPKVQAIAAFIVLGIMAIPTISTVSEDAIKVVPNELREAAYGLGATKWQTTRKVLLPYAKSGILASIILALGAAIGEVMAIYFILGVKQPGPDITLSPFTDPSVLTSLLLTAAESDFGLDGEFGHAVFGIAFVLFVICAILNIVTRIIVSGSKSGEKTVTARR